MLLEIERRANHVGMARTFMTGIAMHRAATCPQHWFRLEQVRLNDAALIIRLPAEKAGWCKVSLVHSSMCLSGANAQTPTTQNPTPTAIHASSELGRLANSARCVETGTTSTKIGALHRAAPSG